MTAADREDLEKRLTAARQEVSTLKEAITDIDSPAFHGPSKALQLQNLRSVLASRLREIQKLEDQFA